MRHALKAGTKQMIALKDLEPHPHAQRKFDAAHAAQLAKAFDPALLGTITVAETKRGKRWIVDGQHRAKAALQWLNGDNAQCVECTVIPVEDDAESARLFLGLNYHKAVRTLDKFVVRVHARETNALAIMAVLENAGLRVTHNRGEGVVQAVDACEAILKRPRGALLLARVIQVLKSAWGAEPDAYHGQLIRGLGLLLAKYGNAVNDEELVRKIAKRGGPLGLIGRARDHHNATGMSVGAAMCEVLRAVYNKGRHTERLEERAA